MTKNKSIFKVIMENFLHQNFKNKRVIIRVDFNVPLSNDFKVTSFLLRGGVRVSMYNTKAISV